MNCHSVLAASSMCLALLCPVVLAQSQAKTAAAEPLKVFLQGESTAGLTVLVAAQGGRVTHDLHIINAVGAELSREQLERVLQSPEVGRYFDDLALSEPVEDSPGETQKTCDVAGSLELDISETGISWRIHNKRDSPALLEILKLTWPVEFGSISHVSLAGKALDSRLYAETAAGSAELAMTSYPDAPKPSLGETDYLDVQFSSQTGQPPRQRDFTLEATFNGGCSIELIPGYDDNHENFHYNAVAGVEALHLNGVTGRGVTVAVIDSGLWEDPALARDSGGRSRVIARYDAITDTSPAEVFDASGHGTHMTSVIAHSGATTRNEVPTGTFKGVAPDVNLVAVKAFDVAGQGDFLDIVRAIQWVVDHREAYDIRVLNLSFAARPRWNYWLDPINQAVMRAWASGITVIAAAGNEGPDPMTIGSPGNLPFIITVGAVTDSWTPHDKDDDYIPDFSSRGPTPNAHIKPDIVAPGGHITGLTRPGSTLTREHPEYILRTGELVMTGSSQAAALVSGVVALLLQLEPDLSPDDIKCKLITSAEPAINRGGLLAYSPFQQGHGYLNASRAVTLGDRGCGNAEMDIQQEISGAGHSQGPAILDKDGTASLPGLGSMVSPVPPAKGYSPTRKWGVKAHIERNDPPSQAEGEPGHPPPFDWMELYLQERSRIETLSRHKPN